MEAEAQYWMWMKKRQRDQILKDSFSNSSSWEEKAFAEDAEAAAASSVSGCIWPPRSYSCSFCRREFKSAQALGGHMNVHRKDKARLKNSLKVSTNPNCPSDHSCPSSNNDNNNVVVVVVESSSSPLSNSRVSNYKSSSSFSSSSFVQAKHNVKDYVKTNLSVGLKPNICCDEAIGFKRTKTSAVSTLPYFISSDENLDLELRLGPKVK